MIDGTLLLNLYNSLENGKSPFHQVNNRQPPARIRTCCEKHYQSVSLKHCRSYEITNSSGSLDTCSVTIVVKHRVLYDQSSLPWK